MMVGQTDWQNDIWTSNICYDIAYLTHIFENDMIGSQKVDR